MKPVDDGVSGTLGIPEDRPLSAATRAAIRGQLLSGIDVTEAGRREASTARRRAVRRLVPLFGALVLGGAGGSLTTAYAVGDPPRPSADAESLTTVSTVGSPIALTPRSQAALDHLLTGRQAAGPGRRDAGEPPLLMAARGPTAFLRVPLDGGDACFFIGRATSEDAVYELGGGSCWTPRPGSPVLDLSPVQVAGSGGFQVLQVQGFAADGVHAVAVTDLNGQVVAQTAVRDNVYRLTAYPPAGVSALLALDEGGRVLQRLPYRR